jgi:hypothetical protein
MSGAPGTEFVMRMIEPRPEPAVDVDEAQRRPEGRLTGPFLS